MAIRSFGRCQYVTRKRCKCLKYLAEPNLPPSGTLDEPTEVIQNIAPSLITCNVVGLFSPSNSIARKLACGCIACKKWQDMGIDNVDRGQYIRGAIVFLISVRHFADGDRDFEVYQSGFSKFDLLRQLCRIQGPVE